MSRFFGVMESVTEPRFSYYSQTHLDPNLWCLLSLMFAINMFEYLNHVIV